MKKLLIVVDYQKDFVDGALGFPAAKEIEEALCEKISSYQAEGQDIICTLDTHGEDYLGPRKGRTCPFHTASKEVKGISFTAKPPVCWPPAPGLKSLLSAAWPWQSGWKARNMRRSSCAALSPISVSSPTPFCAKRPCPKPRLRWIPPVWRPSRKKPNRQLSW